MSEFLSLTDTGSGQDKVNGKASANGDDSQDSEEEIDEKEVEEQVGDLGMSMKRAGSLSLLFKSHIPKVT